MGVCGQTNIPGIGRKCGSVCPRTFDLFILLLNRMFRLLGHTVAKPEEQNRTDRMLLIATGWEKGIKRRDFNKENKEGIFKGGKVTEKLRGQREKIEIKMESLKDTVCSRSLNPIDLVTYYIKRVKTS